MDYPDKGGSKFLWYPHITLHSTISKKVIPSSARLWESQVSKCTLN